MNFFDSIFEFFAMIWQIITNWLSGLVTLVDVLLQATISVVNLKMFTPSVIFASIGIVTSVGVAKLILGWGNK